jgi:hypothetical protein
LHVQAPVAEHHLQVVPLKALFLLLSKSPAILDEPLELEKADLVRL